MITNKRALLIPCLCLGLLTMINACEEDPVIFPETETAYPIVHCLLSTNDTVHYVRLTKLLSGPGDPEVIAKDRDRFYFKEAQVFIETWDYGYDHLISTVQLEPTLEIPRDEGFFNSDYPLLYKTTQKLPGYLRLRIEIPEINTTVIGYSYAAYPCTLTTPDSSQKKQLDFFESYPVTISWADDSYFYCKTTIRFNYLEVTDHSADSCHIDWVRNKGNFTLDGKKMLEYIGTWIHQKNDVRYRKVLGFDFILDYGDHAFKQYTAQKDWMLDVIQKPYTNLINAYGIMAGISTNTIKDFQPNQKFLDSLANCSLTQSLKFVDW